MVTGDMISENSGSEHIIDDILLEIEAQSSAFLTEVLPREIFSEVVSDDIGFMRDMRSDKGSDILTWCRESIDSILDDMRVCTTPATMDSCTFSFTHEDDDGAIGGEGSDADTRKAARCARSLSRRTKPSAITQTRHPSRCTGCENIALARA